MYKGPAETEGNVDPRPGEGRLAPALTQELIEGKTKRNSWYDTWGKIKRWSLIQLQPPLTSANFRSRGLGKTNTVIF